MFKSIFLITSCAAVAGPAQAFENMQQSDCRESFVRVAEMADVFDAGGNSILDALMSASRVNRQGWCLLEADDLPDGPYFKTLEWRAEGIRRWTNDGIPPLALEVRVTGLDPDQMQDSLPTDRPPLTFEATFRQESNAGMVLVERAAIFNDVGDSLQISGVFERVFLSSTSMMQVSMGSAAFKAGLMSMTLDGTYENPFAFNLDVDVRGNPQALRDDAFENISRLPDGLMDDASRAELTAYAGDLPNPVGTLEVSVASERGLGLMQVGMSAYNSFSGDLSGDVGQPDFGIMFDGLTAQVDWSPATSVAD